MEYNELPIDVEKHCALNDEVAQTGLQHISSETIEEEDWKLRLAT